MGKDIVVRKPSLSKASTFTRGLDLILERGFPRSRTTGIKGAAGSDKTVLGLEFLYRGAKNGDPGIFIGFEESKERLQILLDILRRINRLIIHEDDI